MNSVSMLTDMIKFSKENGVTSPELEAQYKVVVTVALAVNLGALSNEEGYYLADKVLAEAMDCFLSVLELSSLTRWTMVQRNEDIQVFLSKVFTADEMQELVDSITINAVLIPYEERTEEMLHVILSEFLLRKMVDSSVLNS